MILKVDQLDTINNLYLKYNDTIKVLKADLTIKNKKYDSIFNTISTQKDSVYHWKYKYNLNKSIYEDWEANQRKIDKIQAASKLMLIFIIILQFSQLQ